MKKLKVLGSLILVFFIANSLIQNYFDPVQNFAPLNPAQRNWIKRYNHSNRALFDFLRNHSITGVYKDPDEIFKLKYLGYPDIFVSDFYQDNYPPDAQKSDAAENTAFVLRNNIQGLSASLKAMNVGYQTSQLPDYLVLHSFVLNQDSGKPIDSTRWKATSSHQNPKASNAFDRIASTRWSSDTPKQKGMWFELDLGRTETISRVCIHPGNWQDYPNGLKVEVSNNRQQWTTVTSYPFAFGPFYWDGTHPFYRIRRARVDLNFQPVQARYLRFTHLGESSRYFWSIMELYVYGPAAEKEKSDLIKEAGEIITALKENQIEFAAADHWLSARIGSQTEIKVYQSNLFTGINREIDPEPNALTPLMLNDKTALILTRKHEEETSALLNQQGISFTHKRFGRYILYFGFKQKNPRPFYWAGDHLLEL